MESNHHLDALTALGHSGRLAVFRLLARRAPHGVRPGEIIGALGIKPSTLSMHLAVLDRAGLVTARRDGKLIYYAIALDEVGDLVDFLVNDCCHGRPELCAPLAAHSLGRLTAAADATSGEPANVLFVCIGNSARSIIAEAILNRIGAGRFRAFSAGTRPAAEPNRAALGLLRAKGYDTSGLRSKTVEALQGAEAPRFDFVFTLCDAAANEECPPWSGQPITAHWGLPDPVRATGTEADLARAFEATYQSLRGRLADFVDLPFAALGHLALQHRLDDIGRGATATG